MLEINTANIRRISITELDFTITELVILKTTRLEHSQNWTSVPTNHQNTHTMAGVPTVAIGASRQSAEIERLRHIWRYLPLAISYS